MTVKYITKDVRVFLGGKELRGFAQYEISETHLTPQETKITVRVRSEPTEPADDTDEGSEHD